jgi:4-azaleucine resistance transporter AzlC
LHQKTGALKAAFPYTIPVLTGYIFLGIAFGILLGSKGYHFGWAFLMSFAIYAGSMQFVAINLLTSVFNPLNAFLITLVVNARHLFYGLSMLGKYRDTGKKKPYLVFGLTDETFSIVCSTEPPDGINKEWFMFFITLLDQIYWIAGSLLGSLLGALFTFNSKGIDFIMTALFIVIFINQWESRKNHIPAMVGVGASVISLIIFGSANFIIPSMLLILSSLTLCRSAVVRRTEP